jgi:hypothetical protein
LFIIGLPKLGNNLLVPASIGVTVASRTSLSDIFFRGTVDRLQDPDRIGCRRETKGYAITELRTDGRSGNANYATRAAGFNSESVASFKSKFPPAR